jgi:DNA-binding NarL/FixJ family response regulator
MDDLKKIIVAEDNPRDQEFLLKNLVGYEITVFSNGDEAFAGLGNEESPCILSDIQMPGLNGIALASEIWKQKPQAKIVFWSNYKDEIYVRSLSKIIPPETVYGYVLKSNPIEVLEKALYHVFEDYQCWIDPLLRPVQARNQQSRSPISDAEYDVLLDIALGLTDQLIAQRRFLSRRGVQSRLKSLYQKLGVERSQIHEGPEQLNPRTRAVNVALQRGLLNSYELQLAEDELNTWLKSRKQ